MRSLLEYRGIFKGVLDNLNIKGDSAEILRQLFAYSAYINEVENAVYLREASIEKAALMNSKIQHCINEMYSVYRGLCPRAVLRITPTRIMSLSRFSKVTSSNSFGVFYLGYLDNNKDEFIYSSSTLMPNETYTIICALAKQTHSGTYTFNKDDFFVNFTEPNLSNDILITSEGQEYSVTRLFSDHIMNGKVFDLTLPDFGSRLYLLNSNVGDESSTIINASYLKYSLLDTYNTTELERLAVKGAKTEAFPEGWLDKMGYPEETKPGIVYLPETSRDTIGTIHYKAYRERFTSSLFRSNDDIGALLEATYPEKIVTNGTSIKIHKDDNNEESMYLYYIPENDRELDENEIENFKNVRSPYYVKDDKLEIVKGKKYSIKLLLNVVLYRPGTIEEDVRNILEEYKNKFGIDLREIPGGINTELEELRSSISKISNVRWINEISLDFIDNLGNPVSDLNRIDPETSYFSDIEPTIITSFES